MALKAIESATAVIGNVHLVYDKDEADRYINWLKYKRCFAMAKLCQEKRERRLGLLTKRGAFYHRWFRKWLSLAGKYKEVNGCDC